MEKQEKKKDRKWLWGTVLIAIILSLTYFYVLYCANNKYRTTEEKAIHGLLYVEESYEDLPVYYLSREWEYYPNVLLTPEDDLEKYYCRYLSIGEYGGMELDDSQASPYGSATYRLILALPEEEHTYGLYLPEIFSAYALYIDGSLVEQVGNPDPVHYQEQIQNRMFTFKGKGMVELMIAVTDKGSSSSGIQYVPAFGNPVKINTIRGIPVFLNSCMFTLVFLVMVFSIWTFFRTRLRANLMFAGVCICVLGYTCYPLLHTYMALRIQPWYTLEMLFYFLAFPAMLLLVDEITKESYDWIKGTVYFTLCAGSLVTIGGVFAGRTQQVFFAYVVSWGTEVLKWFTAVCLLVIALLYAQEAGERLLLTGTVIYASSLIADRLWPLYDPIFGGWFPEWGGTILAGIFGVILWRELLEGYRMRLLYEEQSRQMELRLLMQKEHYEKLTEVLEEAGRTRHDLRQYIRTASTLLEHGQYEQLKEYFHRFAKESQETLQTPVCYCKNMSVDAILHYYASQLETAGITFRCQVEVPEKLKISDLDICRIFGNLLENAANAVLAEKEEKEAYVSCICSVRMEKLLIQVENTYNGKIYKEGEDFYSTMHSGRGIGTVSVRKTAEKYGGYADFSAEGNVFKANVFLPLGSFFNAR